MNLKVRLDPPAIADDPNLAALAAELRRTAPPGVPDPLFRTSLRASLVESRVELHYAALETPVGRLWLAYQDDAPRLIAAGDEETFLAKARRRFEGAPVQDPAPPARLVQRVLAVIQGHHRYRGPLDLSCLTAFQRSVLEQTRRIPRGEVRSYAWIAREIGHPAAVRAVGSALARNPLPFLIPCHRVIRGDGDLGSYSGGGDGTKERILTYEGVDLEYLKTLAKQGVRFRGSRNTKIFCLPTCYSHKWASEEHTVYFHAASDAFAAGFRPCKLCRPVAAASS